MAKGKRAVWCVVLAAAVLALCSKCSPLYAFNDWMDANIFFTMGKSMMQGRVLYRDVFDHKGPLLYLVYGLGTLLDATGFTGVFVVEIGAFAAFLALGLGAAECLLQRPLHPAWAAVPAAAVAAGRAFSHGGSAEELLLPFLAAALYGLLRVLHTGRPMPLGRVFLQGLLAGCALWLKYTVLGFYLAWVLVLAVLYGQRGWYAGLAESCGAYLGGMAAATLPWCLYFGLNGALRDWFTAYFYDNLFLYSGNGGGAAALAQHLWWAVRDALPTALLLGMFLVWAALTRHRRQAGAVVLLAAGLGFTSLMGGYLVYYGLVLAVFAPLGIAPLAALGRGIALPGTVRRALPAAALAAAVLYCWVGSPNRALRGRDAETLPQIRFARIIWQQPETGLLNYGTLDGGFYTASGLLPPCRYFCVTNMPLEEQWTEQNTLLEEGTVGYAVALVGDLEQRFPQYRCIDQCSYDGGEGTVTWYLYQRQP